MKILAVCQHYYPEPFRFTDICEELVKRGHEVTVVTGTPNYPMGKIYEGYGGKKKRDEAINGVKVHRCFEIGRRTGVLFRFLNYYSFAISSKRYIKRMKEKFDVVLANQLSPVMMIDGAVAYKKKHGVKLVEYVLDLWPESLIVGGVKRGSTLYKHYHKVSKKLYRAADKLLVTSRSFEDYLTQNFGIEQDKLGYLPQYAEDTFSAEACKKARGENDTVDLLFAGNIGKLQSVQTIIKTARLLKDRKDIVFHIVGEGISLPACRKLAEGLDNVVFYGRLPLEQMPSMYKIADAMLVTMINDDVICSVLPGKVQSYMASGKPIIGSIGGEAKQVIDEAECGFCGEAENERQLKENILAFVNSTDKQTFGLNALQYYKENFTKEAFFQTLEQTFGEG